MEVIYSNPYEVKSDVKVGASVELFTLVFPKNVGWTLEKAKKWIENRKYPLKGHFEETEKSFRFLLEEPHKREITKDTKFRYSGVWKTSDGKVIIPLYIIPLGSKTKTTLNKGGSMPRGKTSKFKEAWKRFKSMGGVSPKLQPELWKKAFKGSVGDFIDDEVDIGETIDDIVADTILRNPYVVEYDLMENPGIPLFTGKDRKLRDATIEMFNRIFSQGSPTVSRITHAINRAKMLYIHATGQRRYGTVTEKHVRRAIKKYINEPDEVVPKKYKKNAARSLGYGKVKGTYEYDKGTGKYVLTGYKEIKSPYESYLGRTRRKDVIKTLATGERRIKGGKSAVARANMLKFEKPKVGTPQDVGKLRSELKGSGRKLPRLLREKAGEKYTIPIFGSLSGFASTFRKKKTTETTEKKTTKKGKKKKTATSSLIPVWENPYRRYPRFISEEIEDFVEEDVGAPVYVTNPYLDAVISVVANAGVGVGSVKLFNVLEEKVMSKLTGKIKDDSKLSALKKPAFTKGIIGILGFTIGKVLETIAERKMYGKSSVIMKDVSKTVQVVSSLYAFSGVVIKDKSLVNISSQPVGSVIPNKYIPAGAVIKEDYYYNPTDAIIRNENIETGAMVPTTSDIPEGALVDDHGNIIPEGGIVEL